MDDLLAGRSWAAVLYRFFDYGALFGIRFRAGGWHNAAAAALCRTGALDSKSPSTRAMDAECPDFTGAHS